MESRGLVRRYHGVDGKIVNQVASEEVPPRPSEPQLTGDADLITEDQVKAAVRDYFVAQGYDVAVAWVTSEASTSLPLEETKGS